MTEHNENHHSESADSLAKVFDLAEARPRPTEQSTERAFVELHAKWQQNLQATRRRSMWQPLAAAAGLVLAIGIVWMYSGHNSLSPDTLVASLARMSGDYATVRTISAGERPAIHSNNIVSGSVVTTGPATRLALAWMPGGSLRLDENTRVEIVSDANIRLLAGAIYYDSKPGAPASRKTAALTIETPSGNVRHLGTQFMVQVDDDGATVSVREGQIRFDGPGLDIVVDPGYQISVDKQGMQSQRQVERYNDVWNWVEEIAPHFQADGQSASAVLDWIARETGRELIYDAGSRRIAHQTLVHGITNVTPDNALHALGIATDLQIKIVNGKIEVEERTRK